MEIVKKFGVPATLAVAGVEVSKLFGITNPLLQIVAAIGGAGVGLFIATKVG